MADNNTFLGPPDPIVQQLGFHNNVFQLFGDSQNINLSNNVIRNTGSRGQTIVIDSTHNLRVNNNLIAEDPACLTNVNCYPYAFAACRADGLQFTHNTIVDSYWGVQITNTGNAACDGKIGARYTVTNNLFVRPDGRGGNPEIDYAECTSSCTFDYNVSDDSSVFSTHSLTEWSPRWANVRSFRPAALPFAAGYAFER